jgi:3-polyprenyl-4-hydroxybenzoate decarboxylase
MMQSKILDTSFRSALSRMAKNKRLRAYDKPVDQHLEATAILKKFDGRVAILFSAV